MCYDLTINPEVVLIPDELADLYDGACKIVCVIVAVILILGIVPVFVLGIIRSLISL